jgi:hypothetical protein
MEAKPDPTATAMTAYSSHFIAFIVRLAFDFAFGVNALSITWIVAWSG